MTIGPDIATNLIASVLYDILKGGLSVLRKRQESRKWVESLSAAVRRRGVHLNSIEAKKFANWVRTWNLDLLTSAADGGSAELVRVLSIDVFGVAEHTNSPDGSDLTEWAALQEDRATELAGALWGALDDELTAAERIQLRSLVASEHTDETATSALTELGWLRGEVAELSSSLVRTLPLERARLRPPPGSSLSPYELLWPRFGVVPFDDRTGRLDELTDWCEASDRISVQIVSGAGGMGKTRLALELCGRMAGRGWLAGLYTPGGEAAVEALAAVRLQRLVVFDYADEQITTATDLVAKLAERLPLRAHPIRLLLLVRRNPPSGDARRMFATGQSLASHYLEQRPPITLSTSSDGHAEAEHMGLADRQRLFHSAVDVFRQRTGATPGRILEPDLAQATFGSPTVSVGV